MLMASTKSESVKLLAELFLAGAGTPGMRGLFPLIEQIIDPPQHWFGMAR